MSGGFDRGTLKLQSFDTATNRFFAPLVLGMARSFNHEPVSHSPAKIAVLRSPRLPLHLLPARNAANPRIHGGCFGVLRHTSQKAFRLFFALNLLPAPPWGRKPSIQSDSAEKLLGGKRAAFLVVSTRRNTSFPVSII